MPTVPERRRRRADVVARRLRHEAVLGELLPALRARGVRPMLIKGPATAALLYDAPYDRPFADLDLLVADDERDAAESVLEGLGFRPVLAGLRRSERADRHAEPWELSRVNARVDLHRSLALVEDGARLLAVLRRDARAMPLRSATAEVPSDAACALIVVLHAAQHPPRNLQPLEDLRCALARLPYAQWVEAATLASELDATGAFATGLSRLPAGRTMATRMNLEQATTTSTRQKPEHASAGAQYLERTLHAGSVSAALASLRDALFPSPEWMRTSDPSLGSNRRRLLAAYVRRQGKIPRGLIDYARIRLRSRAR